MSFWAWMLSWKKSPVRIRMPIAIKTAPRHGHDRRVVTLDHRERRGHPREGECRQQEGDPQARRVHGQEQRTVRRRARQGGRAQDRSERGADAGRPGDREGHSSDQRPALPGPCHERLDVPLAVEAGDEQAGHEQDAHGDDHGPRDLLEGVAVVLKRLPEPGRGQPEEDEDGREARHEDQARAEHAPPIRPLELAHGHPRDGGQVPGDEGQHTRGDERHEPGAEGRQDAHP